ncbi:hypothetical protein B0H10DRAFT_1965495, partial [Mycena sp. CBHHK59/15]
ASRSVTQSESERSSPLVLGGLAAREGRTSATSRGSIRGRGRGNARRGRGGRTRRGGATEHSNEGDDDGLPPDIEEWVNSKELRLASMLGPEFRVGDLGRVFEAPKLAISPSDVTKSKVQLIREALGGDYSRFTPQNSSHFISAARRIGPVKHSRVALAHHKDVPVEDRNHVGDIVGTVVRR